MYQSRSHTFEYDTTGSVTNEEEDWYRLFQRLDYEGKGYIRNRDLRHRLRDNNLSADLSQRTLEGLIDYADKNEDSKIEYDEFCYLMSSVKHQRGRGILYRAAQAVVPKSQRSSKFRYLQKYNCCPPPFFIITITLIEIALYIYYVVDDPDNTGISISGPTPTYSPLIYDPRRRYQAWRYLSYIFIHIGVYHILFNCLTQVVLGIPLELVHKWYRVGTVYLLGAIMGSLAVSVCDPKVFLAGASGGVYALLAAHVANLVVNWSEMEFAWIRLIFLTVLIGSDFGVAIYNRVKGTENSVSFVAHLGGFFAGLLLGIVVLRNFRKRAWERVVWWIALVGFGLMLTFAVFWNIFYNVDNYYYDSVFDPFLIARRKYGFGG